MSGRREGQDGREFSAHGSSLVPNGAGIPQTQRQEGRGYTGENIASFPGPTQLFVACSTDKRGEPGISGEPNIIDKWKKKF